MKNKNTKTTLLFGASALVVAALTAVFVIPIASHLLKSGFTLQNILTGKLPENYLTSDGSDFNAVQTVLWVGGGVTVILGLVSAVLLIKSKKAHG